MQRPGTRKQIAHFDVASLGGRDCQAARACVRKHLCRQKAYGPYYSSKRLVLVVDDLALAQVEAKTVTAPQLALLHEMIASTSFCDPNGFHLSTAFVSFLATRSLGGLGRRAVPEVERFNLHCNVICVPTLTLRNISEIFQTRLKRSFDAGAGRPLAPRKEGVDEQQLRATPKILPQVLDAQLRQCAGATITLYRKLAKVFGEDSHLLSHHLIFKVLQGLEYAMRSAVALPEERMVIPRIWCNEAARVFLGVFDSSQSKSVQKAFSAVVTSEFELRPISVMMQWPPYLSYGSDARCLGSASCREALESILKTRLGWEAEKGAEGKGEGDRERDGEGEKDEKHSQEKWKEESGVAEEKEGTKQAEGQEEDRGKASEKVNSTWFDDQNGPTATTICSLVRAIEKPASMAIVNGLQRLQTTKITRTAAKALGFACHEVFLECVPSTSSVIAAASKQAICGAFDAPTVLSIQLARTVGRTELQKLCKSVVDLLKPGGVEASLSSNKLCELCNDMATHMERERRTETLKAAKISDVHIKEIAGYNALPFVLRRIKSNLRLVLHCEAPLETVGPVFKLPEWSKSLVYIRNDYAEAESVQTIVGIALQDLVALSGAKKDKGKEKSKSKKSRALSL